jgi:Transglycosylase SLT domain
MLFSSASREPLRARSVIVLYFFTSIPEFRPDSIACSARAVRALLFQFATVRVCACVRISEDDMRHLHMFACLCLLTISGTTTVAAGDDAHQVPPDTQTATVESSSSTMEQAAPRAAGTKAVVQRSKREICDTLVESAQSSSLPIPFFIRLLLQESDFKPDVVSRAGAQGIAQFMPETAATVGLDNPFDPLQAIAASARLLRNLVRQFGNLGLAAAAYNAGPRRIQDWLARKGKLPQETQHYVKTITGRPAETWKAAKASSPVDSLPKHAPCREDAGPIASNGPENTTEVATRSRAVASFDRKKTTRSLAARGSEKAHVAKREKGAIQLAAASKKGRHKVRLSQG